MDKDAKESKERIDPEREEMEKRGRQKERKKREEVHGELLNERSVSKDAKMIDL